MLALIVTAGFAAVRPAAAQPAVVTPPRLLESAPAERPDQDDAPPPGAASPAARPEVAIDLELTIDADGAVADAKVATPAERRFEDAALAAVRRYRFVPARRDDTPVPVRVRFQFHFPALPATPRIAAATAPPAALATKPDDPVDADADTGDDTGDYDSYGATARVRELPRGTTRRTIEGSALTDTPGTRGDPLRVIELLPGVARPPLGAGLVIIRGSAPGDSEVSFEGAPVLRLYHFDGLTSFVNGRLVDHIDLYPGNFSAKYGRKIGGVIDVGARDPRTDGFHALADMNVIDATVMAEGPIGRHAAIAVSARRSHFGDILSALSSDGSILTAPVYDDYQLFLTVRPTERDRIRFLGYGSRDELAVLIKAPDQDPVLGGPGSDRTYFHHAQLSWDHRYSDRVSHTAQVTVGTIGFVASLGDSLSQNITGPELFSRDEVNLHATDHLTLALGADLSAQWLHARYHGPVIGQEEGDPSQMGPLTVQPTSSIAATVPFFRPAGYLEATWHGPGGFTLIGGGRADYFGDIHQTTFDPRLTARLAVTEQTTIKGGAGVFSQPPDYGQAVPGFGNPKLHAERALHLDLGIDQTWGPGLSVGAETFAKELRHLIVAGDQPGTLVNDGIGRIYGFELQVKAAFGDRASALLSYTLSRSQRRDHPGDGWRLFDYDQTHILTAATAVRLGRNWQLGGTFRLVSGNPETPIVGSLYNADKDVYQPLYGAVNSVRSPLFHRLDLRIEKQWHPGRFLVAGYLDLQNAYDHPNREATAYGFDYRQRVEVTGLPILPSLGVRGEL